MAENKPLISAELAEKITGIDFMGPKYGVGIDAYDGGYRVWVMGHVVLEDHTLSRDINKAHQHSTLEEAVIVAKKFLDQQKDDIA